MIKLIVHILLISTGILQGPNNNLSTAFKFGKHERCKFVSRCIRSVGDSDQQIDAQKIAQSEEAELAAIAVTEKSIYQLQSGFLRKSIECSH